MPQKDFPLHKPESSVTIGFATTTCNMLNKLL